jgi:hypothetical protein
MKKTIWTTTLAVGSRSILGEPLGSETTVCSVSDPHPFYADPTYKLNADPDPCLDNIK